MFEYSWFHIAPWGAELSIYFFLVGMAGMAFVLASAPEVFGSPAAMRLKPVQMPALLVALVLLILCGPLLILDLGQPGRFLYPILYFHWTSPLSWGSVFLLMFGACVVIFGFGLVTNRAALLRPVGVIGSLLGLSMPLYTGLDLMVNTTRDLWNSPWTPVLFTVLAVTSGTGLVALIAMLRRADDAMPVLRQIMGWSVGVTLFLFLGLWVMFLYGGEELQQGWVLLNTEFGTQLWVVTFLVGIVVPLVLLVLPLANQPAVVVLAGLGAMVGAYSFRDMILIAGQMPQLFY